MQLQTIPFETEPLRKEIEKHLVGPAIFGWCRHSDLKRTVVFPDDVVPLRIRLHPNRNRGSFGMIFNENHSASRPAKSVVPRRMKVAPSSMAISKSLLIPIDNVCRSKPV